MTKKIFPIDRSEDHLDLEDPFSNDKKNVNKCSKICDEMWCGKYQVATFVSTLVILTLSIAGLIVWVQIS